MPIDWTAIILAVLGGIVSIAGAYLIYLAQRIHTAVNSERTAMIAEVRRLNELLTGIRAQNGERFFDAPDTHG